MAVVSPQRMSTMQGSRTENPSQDAEALASLLAKTMTLHDHLCPRQVLGVRMGMLAGELLGLTLPQTNKRLLAFVETDGCFSDGVGVATGCTMGHRTMRLVDYGKVAATFVDTRTRVAWRIVPSSQARSGAAQYAPEASNRWQAMLLGYQRMKAEELLTWQSVTLTLSLEEIVSKAGLRAHCDVCGEEIINGREVAVHNGTLCRFCAGGEYYQPANQ